MKAGSKKKNIYQAQGRKKKYWREKGKKKKQKSAKEGKIMIGKRK